MTKHQPLVRAVPPVLIAVVTSLSLLLAAVMWSAPNADAAEAVTVWGSSRPSSAVVDSDREAVELGTRFTAVTSGQATGVRFYKTPENSGTHLGSLWTDTGALLARVTFSSETASGWQVANFASPVSLTAGKSYVVSYHTNVGRYVSTENHRGASISPSFLTVPSTNAGVYAYGASSNFPKQSWRSSQYWVDVTFKPTSAATPTPSTTTRPASTPSPTPTSSAPSSSPTPRPTPSAPSSSPTPTSPSSPTATPSSTPTSSGLTNCVSLPSRCGYPDATNTGVPAGRTLRRVPQEVQSGPGWVWDSRGWLQASSGAVVSDVIVSGSINVGGSNITVKNTRVLVGGETWGIGLQHATNAVISDNEIGIAGGSPRLLVGIKDVYGDATGTQVLRNDIVNTSTGVQTHEGLIADNYIHDMGYASGDHINGTTSNGSTRALTIRHNTVFNQYGQTDAISLFQDFGIEANRLITDNFVAGGGYTIYGGDNRRFGRTSNIRITNNRFSNVFFPRGGSYGPITAFDPAGAGNVASGNYWDHNLAPVN